MESITAASQDPGEQKGFCSEPRGEVIVMEQFLVGNISEFVWCADLSQKVLGHRF